MNVNYFYMLCVNNKQGRDAADDESKRTDLRRHA